MRSGSWGMLRTSRCELSALAGAAVIVSVLGAELGASVGEAAGPSCSATKALGMKAGWGEGRNRILTAGPFIHNANFLLESTNVISVN